MSDETPTALWIRMKAKGTEFQDDLHHFTDRWQEVPIGEVRAAYFDNDNLEVRDEKPAPSPKDAKDAAVKEPEEDKK